MSVLSTITRHLPHRITTGAMADEFGGTTRSGGYQIAGFTPSVVETIRLAATVAALESLYRTQPSVRICVSFLAQAIAPLNIKLFRGMTNGDTTRVYTHPLEDLLQRPNPRTSRFEMFRDTTSDIAIYDAAYWLKQFTRGGDRRLYRLPPTWVTPQGGSVITGPAYYELRNPATGELTRYEPDQIVHFHGYNPTDGRIGMSPLQALHYVLNEDLQASRHRGAFWKNGAQQDAVNTLRLRSAGIEEQFAVEMVGLGVDLIAVIGAVTARAVRLAHRSRFAARLAQSRELGVDGRRQEHVVGDRRDLLRLLPRLLQQIELALEGAALGVLVRRHLERETRRERHALERRAAARIAESRPAPRRERLRGAHEQSLG